MADNYDEITIDCSFIGYETYSAFPLDFGVDRICCWKAGLLLQHIGPPTAL